ncbi:DUF3105 domain-containing protein [Actinomycetes bacterium M1A6_2h]
MPSGSDKGAKSAKAIKAASQKKPKKKGGVPGAGAKGRRQIPWLTIGAVVVVIALIGVLAANLYPKYQDRVEAQKFAPSESNQDPSTGIDGVVVKTYPAALHVAATQRVAYDESPPFGGPHDQVWANCMGTVYPTAIRTENAVHGLEHGAVWITYNPDDLSADQVADLAKKVDGQQYTMMSPYPGLDHAVSLQSWGHQLKLDSPDDPRIDQFISALRLNRFQYPEVGASCSTTPETFDVDNPPPFDPSAPGPDAVPMDGAGITPDSTETGAAGGSGLPTDLQIPTGTPNP